MSDSLSFTAEQEDRDVRLDLFLCGRTEGEYSRAFLQKQISLGNVTVNQKKVKAGFRLSEGDVAELLLPEPVPVEAIPENIPLDILYEDDDLIVVNKPKGMVVHPAAGHESGTLVNALLYHCNGSLSGINGVLRPGIVHRIDRDTTGVLVACKNDDAHRALAAQLETHSITRRYRAIAWGRFKEEEGTVDAPIGRHPVDRKKMAVNYKNGKHAVTHYKVLEEFSDAAYLECRLETGRTHQIRVHLSSIGHPLLGDEVYGRRNDKYSLQGQVLHAMVLGFVHPSTHTYMEFSAPLPDYFNRLIQTLR